MSRSSWLCKSAVWGRNNLAFLRAAAVSVLADCGVRYWLQESIKKPRQCKPAGLFLELYTQDAGIYPMR